MAEVSAVREALRTALVSRGFDVQSDTHARGRSLYVMGDNDLAAALFEIHATPREAIDAMYQGAWTAGLPPRFAVLPSHAAADEDFELLEQMRIAPLLYAENGGVEFPDLERLLAENLAD